MPIHKPIHPGLLVKEVLIDATGMSVTEAATRLGVTRPALSRLLNGHADLSPKMALRLSKLLNTSIDMWVNLQAQYDIWKVHQEASKLKIKPLDNAA